MNEQLWDRDNRKVHGLIVIDGQNRLKFVCTACDGEFQVIASFANHIAAHNWKDVKPIIDSIELSDDESDHKLNTSNQQSLGNISANTSQTVEHSNLETTQENVKDETAYRAPIRESNDANISASTSNETTNENIEVTTPEVSDQRQSAQNASTKTNKPVYKCVYCVRQYSTKIGLLRHLRAHHKNQFLFHCDFCPFSSNNQNELQLHTRNHIIIPKYKCEFCDETLYTKFQKVNHKKERHTNAMRTCKPCGKRFNSARNLCAHTVKFHTKQ